ncbi:MAG: hypothetical protein WCO05_01905 [Candidatus Moraniibacteriota bacterium]|jgi:hypothetical protein
MIIHVTREICWVVISGANGNESLIKFLLQGQELNSEIARLANDPKWLSQDDLRKKLLKAINVNLPKENMDIRIY